MTIRHMKIFIRVYQTGSITKAADELHMTQPAVTRSIQELERYYDLKLFERLNHRLFITECGRELYPRALHLVSLFDQMESMLQDQESHRCIRVGATITLGNYLLPRLACLFRGKHPDIRIQARIASSAQIRQAVENNDLDLAMIEGEVNTPHLHCEPFCSDHLTVIIPPDHPLAQRESLSISDLACEPLLLREPGSAGRSFLNSVFEAHGFSISPLWESTSTQALVRAVSMGLGLSILPEQLVRSDIARGAVLSRTVSDERLERVHYLVWHENKYLSDSMKDFLNLARRFCSEEYPCLKETFDEHSDS